MTDSEIFKVIRALISDTNPNYTIYTDEFLGVFVEEAKKRVPYFAAALVAVSIGAYEAAEIMMAMAGGVVTIRSNSDGEQQTADSTSSSSC